jgi:heptosyltransferase I
MIRLSSMGDVIHALPAAAALKNRFPESHVIWLIRPKWMPLLKDNPFVDEIVPVERSVRASLGVARSLRKRHIDLAVDFQGLIQSALLAKALGAKELAGFDRTRVRERAAAWFYSQEIRTSAQHAVDKNLELAAGVVETGMDATGAGATGPAPRFGSPHSFYLPPGSPEGSLPEGKFVLACPLAGWGSKQWPLEHWSKFAAILHESYNLPLVLNGPPSSAQLLHAVSGAQVHLSGIEGLIDATRRAHVVIGIDSGPMHMAAALEKPGVALFGPTDPARHGPYGVSLSVLRDANAITDYRRHAEPAQSMRAITPRMVFAALTAALEGEAHAAAQPRPQLRNNIGSCST